MISKTARPLTGQGNLYNDSMKLKLYGKVYYKGLIGRMKKGECMKEEREGGQRGGRDMGREKGREEMKKGGKEERRKEEGRRKG